MKVEEVHLVRMVVLDPSACDNSHVDYTGQDIVELTRIICSVENHLWVKTHLVICLEFIAEELPLNHRTYATKWTKPCNSSAHTSNVIFTCDGSTHIFNSCSVSICQIIHIKHRNIRVEYAGINMFSQSSHLKCKLIRAWQQVVPNTDSLPPEI